MPSKIVNKELKDLKVGDKIIGSDGKPVMITHVFDKYIPKDMYQITMDDGQTIKCSGNHLWYCETDEDRAFKKKYFKLAKSFFRHNSIPEYDMYMPAYPFNLVPDKFSQRKKGQQLLQHVCLSLGPTYQTPHVYFDGLKYVKENKLYTYSYNDIIDFLKRLKLVVNKDPNQYFYFGQVRETSTIAKLMQQNQTVNIPQHADINHSNLNKVKK